jgi:hypothetical protein
MLWCHATAQGPQRVTKSDKAIINALFMNTHPLNYTLVTKNENLFEYFDLRENAMLWSHATAQGSQGRRKRISAVMC